MQLLVIFERRVMPYSVFHAVFRCHELHFWEKVEARYLLLFRSLVQRRALISWISFAVINRCSTCKGRRFIYSEFLFQC